MNNMRCRMTMLKLSDKVIDENKEYFNSLKIVPCHGEILGSEKDEDGVINLIIKSSNSNVGSYMNAGTILIESDDDREFVGELVSGRNLYSYGEWQWSFRLINSKEV